MRTSILGINLDGVSLEESLLMVGRFLKSGRVNLIVTPNPEFLLEARRNQEFKSILNSADLSLPDGVGLIFASVYLGKPRLNRISGTDFVWALAGYASENNSSIYLLGGERGVAKKTAAVLTKKYPELKIAGAVSDYSSDGKMIADPEIVNLINKARPGILLVAFGAPKQEIWIQHNKDQLKTVKVAMGVGGAFDYISGQVKRAPIWMRKLGLEWLFRVFRQPFRIKRIINAVLKFPLLVVKIGKNE